MRTWFGQNADKIIFEQSTDRDLDRVVTETACVGIVHYVSVQYSVQNPFLTSPCDQQQPMIIIINSSNNTSDVVHYGKPKYSICTSIDPCSPCPTGICRPLAESHPSDSGSGANGIARRTSGQKRGKRCWRASRVSSQYHAAKARSGEARTSMSVRSSSYA